MADLGEDTLATLRPGLAAQPWVLSSAVPDGLVQNAIVHGFEGRERGEVRVSATAAADWIDISVSDDGIGMPATVLAHVFEPFFTTRLGRGGSGLGLSICHRLVARVLGGELLAQSQPGQGSEFRIRLPRVAPAGLEAAPPARPSNG